MKELMISILEYVTEERELPEDLIYTFSKEATKILQCRQVSSLPKSFWDLADYVGAFWRGRRYEYMENSLVIYQMGQLLSFTNMISMMAEETEKELSVEEHAEQWKERYPIFLNIHKQKGITHKALAEAAKISPSNLSQFMNKVQWEGIFYCRAMGREKHYYLTEYGEKIYELMRQRHERTNWDQRVFKEALGNFNKRSIRKWDGLFDNVMDTCITNQELYAGLLSMGQKKGYVIVNKENEEKVEVCSV